MMTTSSTVSSISDSRWEETSTAWPSAAWLRMKVRSHWMPWGSRPLAGSSRMRISGSPSSAVASCRRWRMPRENLPTRRRATSVRPTSSRVSSTRRERDAAGQGHRLQVVLGPAGRVEAGGLEGGAHVADRVVEVDVAPAAEGGRALGDRTPGRAACAAWWSCPSRWGRGTRSPGPAATSKVRSSTARIGPNCLDSPRTSMAEGMPDGSPGVDRAPGTPVTVPRGPGGRVRPRRRRRWAGAARWPRPARRGPGSCCSSRSPSRPGPSTRRGPGCGPGR